MDKQAMFKALIGGGGRAFKAIGRKLNQPKVVKMEDYITDPDMLNDLKNPANQVPLNTLDTNPANTGPIGNDNFMGRNKNISGMDFTDVTRGRRTIEPMVENNPVQTAGTFPPLGTPDFTPREKFDQYGKQFIS